MKQEHTQPRIGASKNQTGRTSVTENAVETIRYPSAQYAKAKELLNPLRRIRLDAVRWRKYWETKHATRVAEQGISDSFPSS